MKLKLMPMLIGAVMFAITVPVVAQACPGATGTERDQQLTPQQQSRLEEVRRNTLEQVEAVLTPQQQQQFQTALAQGQGMGSALANLNLSQEQQSQLQDIMQSEKAQKQQLLNQG